MMIMSHGLQQTDMTIVTWEAKLNTKGSATPLIIILL